MFLELKRLRLACLLSQADTSLETGIPVRQLSLAERGLTRLSEPEERLLRELFRRRTALLESDENEDRRSDKSDGEQTEAKNGH